METKTGTEIVNDIFKNISEGNGTLVSVAQKMVGEEKQISFSVEQRKVQPEPAKQPPRAESPMRSHRLHDADGLAEYLKKYKTANTVVMVDIKNQTVYAVLDETAATGFEIITMKPVLHPLFEPWQELMDADEAPTLRTFVDMLGKNRRSIIEPAGKQLVLMLSQVKVSRKITMQKGIGRKCINGILCEMDIAGESKSEQVEIPDEIKIECPLYLATEPVQLTVDLTIDADNSEVYVSCSSADLLEKRVGIFEDMLEKIRAIDGVTVCLGSPQHLDWKYISQRS